MREFTILLRNLGDENNNNIIKNFSLLIEFKTGYYILSFVFNIFNYIIILFFFILFFYLYYNNIKLYSMLKIYLITVIGLKYFIFFAKILIYSIIIFLFLMFIYLYYKKSKEEFRVYLYKIIYRRINFLINLGIFLKIFKINISDFIEYNFLIIIIFIFYIIIDIIIKIFFNKNIKFKLAHFLSIPLLTILFWIFLYFHITNEFVFESLYNDFIGYDDLHYDIIYKNLRNN